MTGTPTDDADLFDDAVLADPAPSWDRLRELGPAVHLTGPDVWFLSRYDVVRAALTDWRTFSSARGVGLNPVVNEAWADAELCTDPPEHAAMRAYFTDQIGPRQLRGVAETIDLRAAELVGRLRAAGRVDGVADCAHDLPVHVIMDLVGWPRSGRDQLLEMAAGSFDGCGPENDRMRAAAPVVAATMAHVAEVVDARSLTPGTFGAHIVEAVDQGFLDRDAAIGMLSGYVIAAFDTTINAIASALWCLAGNPDQWALLRADPSLATAAFNETLRLESPIQYLARVTTAEVDLGDGAVLPAGARVLIGYGAANRDPSHYPDPTEFRLQRRCADQLAFGAGVHACAGQSLARLEGVAVLQALAASGCDLAPAGEPVRALNNMTRGFARLPLLLS